MRHAITTLLMAFVAAPASAALDAVTIKAADQARVEIEHESDPGRRLERLEKFKDSLFAHLQTVPLESLSKPDDFADLNEYSMNVEMITLDRIDAQSCRQAWSSLVAANTFDPEVDDLTKARVPETTRKALELLAAICR